MRMVAAISGGLTVQVDWLGLRIGGQPALSLHSSNEPGELSQWLCHDDSTKNIISGIIIIIIRSSSFSSEAIVRTDRHTHACPIDRSAWTTKVINGESGCQRTTRRGHSLLAAAATSPRMAVTTMTAPTAIANRHGLVSAP